MYVHIYDALNYPLSLSFFLSLSLSLSLSLYIYIQLYITTSSACLSNPTTPK